MKSQLPRILVWGLIASLIVVWSCMYARSWFRARSSSRRGVCQEHLSMIDGAKEQWALENDLLPGALPTVQDLAPSDGSGYMKKFPVCLQGGRYTIGPVGSDPTCDSGLPGHSLSEVGDAITDISDGIQP